MLFGTSTLHLHRAPRLPSEAEQRVFSRFAFDVTRVGKLMSQTKQPDLGVGAPLDLGKSEQVELVLLSLRIATRDHVRRGERLLVLLGRIDAMLDASGGRSSESTVDTGLSLLRAIVRAELLQEESRQRYPRHRALLLTASGFEPELDSTPDKARVFVQDEILRWTPIVKSIGLKLD